MIHCGILAKYDRWLISVLIHKTHDVILLKIRRKNKQLPDRFNSELELSNANSADSCKELTKETGGRAVQRNALFFVNSYEL